MLRELVRGSLALAVTGWLNLALAAVLGILAATDSGTVLGINRWIKPGKFTISIVIFVWTIAWFLRHLQHRPRAVRAIGWGISICMIVEISLITMQAARGTTSHFNHATAFDDAVFSVMGAMIALNTLLVVWVLVLFLSHAPSLPPAYLAGIRLGLLIFLLASAEGGVLVVHGAHTVGAPDGGPGLPLVNWSTKYGDLRVAHFIGMHALQILPLFGYAMRARAAGARFVTALACGYGVVFGWLAYQALRGQPFLAGQFTGAVVAPRDRRCCMPQKLCETRRRRVRRGSRRISAPGNLKVAPRIEGRLGPASIGSLG
jgi:hypothetical protein